MGKSGGSNGTRPTMYDVDPPVWAVSSPEGDVGPHIPHVAALCGTSPTARGGPTPTRSWPGARRHCPPTPGHVRRWCCASAAARGRGRGGVLQGKNRFVFYTNAAAGTELGRWRCCSRGTGLEYDGTALPRAAVDDYFAVRATQPSAPVRWPAVTSWPRRTTIAQGAALRVGRVTWPPADARPCVPPTGGAPSSAPGHSRMAHRHLRLRHNLDVCDQRVQEESAAAHGDSRSRPSCCARRRVAYQGVLRSAGTTSKSWTRLPR